MIDDLIGKPFVWQGKGDGYDCWTLTLEVLRRYGINCDYPVDVNEFDVADIMRAMTEATASPQWEEVGIERPGDVLFTGTARHWRHLCPVVPGGVLHVTRGSFGVMLIPRSALYAMGYRKQAAFRWVG
jgi:cell wall-associated NlpC family hydrolase